MNRNHLGEIAALYVRDTSKARANAVAALENFAATGRGLRYAVHHAHECRVSHGKALQALAAFGRRP